MSRKGEAGTNLTWIIGPCVLIDVSTKTHPRRVAIIDRSDADAVFYQPGRWFAYFSIRKTLIYAGRTKRVGGSCKLSAMQTLIVADVPKGWVRDHKSGDGLDNRRSNLRAASIQQNFWNSRIRTDGISKFRGVTRRENGKWRVRLYKNGKVINLGHFDSETEAALAYDNAAKTNYGEFARLNLGGQHV